MPQGETASTHGSVGSSTTPALDAAANADRGKLPFGALVKEMTLLRPAIPAIAVAQGGEVRNADLHPGLSRDRYPQIS